MKINDLNLLRDNPQMESSWGDFRLQPGGKQEGELGPKKNTKVPVQSQFDLF